MGRSGCGRGWISGEGLRGYLGTSISVSTDEDRINAEPVWCSVIGA